MTEDVYIGKKISVGDIQNCCTALARELGKTESEIKQILLVLPRKEQINLLGIGASLYKSNRFLDISKAALNHVGDHGAKHSIDVESLGWLKTKQSTKGGANEPK